MNGGERCSALRTPRGPWDTREPARCRARVRSEGVLLDPQPSLPLLRRRSAVFVRRVHRYYAAVRLLPNVHAGCPALAFARRSPLLGTSKRSPGSRAESVEACLGSLTTQDCPGTRAGAPEAYGLPLVERRRRPDCMFSKLNTQPTSSPVYASQRTSRYTAQNSGPSGSLLLAREKFSSSASCRFIPAHSTFIFNIF